MNPILTNLVAGATLLLIGWAIGFCIYVVKSDRAREREINALKVKLAELKSEFVTIAQWNEFNTNFGQWKEKVLESINHLAVQLAGLKST